MYDLFKYFLIYDNCARVSKCVYVLKDKTLFNMF